MFTRVTTYANPIMSSSTYLSITLFVCGHLPGKWLFVWLPLMMFLVITNFELSFSTGCLWWDLGIELCRFPRIFLLTVARCYLWLFSLLNVRLAWLSLVMSMMVSCCAVLFSTRYLGWNLELNWVSFWGFSYLLLLLHILVKIFLDCLFSFCLHESVQGIIQ